MQSQCSRDPFNFNAEEESFAQDRAYNVRIIGIIVTCQKYSVQFNLPYCWFFLCNKNKLPFEARVTFVTPQFSLKFGE